MIEDIRYYVGILRAGRWIETRPRWKDTGLIYACYKDEEAGDILMVYTHVSGYNAERIKIGHRNCVIIEYRDGALEKYRQDKAERRNRLTKIPSHDFR